MARTLKNPPLRVHKASKQAYVVLDHRRIYLGRHDLPQTETKYHRLMSEWIANGKRLTVPSADITVLELCDRYKEHCDEYYRGPDGKMSSEIVNVYRAIGGVCEVYAECRAVDFGPLALRTVREKWIADGLRRATINRRVAIIQRLFKWGVSVQLVDAAVWNALQAVEGLRKGRSKAIESTPVTPVLMAHVEAIKPHVSRQVWALIQIQLFTAARSGEVLGLRRIDLDTSGKIWTTRLDHHKTSHHGKARTIYFGVRAQSVLREFFIGKGPTDYLFSPWDAERERRARQHEERKTKEGYGNGPGTNRKANPEWEPGDCYTVASYRRAVARGCKLADVPDWHPHQLRHTAATRCRKEMGLEAAQVWLGHSDAKITEVYAEVDHARALEIAARLG